MKSERAKEHDRIYSRRYRLDHPEWKKMNNIKNRKLVNKSVKEWHRKDPQRSIAYSVLHTALRTGKIKRGNCIFKGVGECSESEMKNPIDAHHEDYKKPLEVIWMCHSHHKKFHFGLLKINQQTQSNLPKTKH